MYINKEEELLMALFRKIEFKPNNLNKSQIMNIKGAVSALIGENLNDPDAKKDEIYDPFEALKPEDAIRILQAMLVNEIPLSDQKEFKNMGVWDNIQSVRNILAHPCCY